MTMNDMVDLGEFVDSDDECDVEDFAEDPERYSQGLYYPVCIGDVFSNRYRIEHKLGHGGFSTVWMAHDMLKKEDIALKIMSPGQPGEHEYHMYKKVLLAVSDTSNLLLCKDTFLVHTPANTHRIVVLPLQGPNLRDYTVNQPIVTRMKGAVQILQALSRLHDGGIVHRDLNSANVMQSLRPFDTSSIATKYQKLGRPRKVPVRPSQWKEGELVRPISATQDLVLDTFFIGDFGLAVEVGTVVTDSFQTPAKYCAPERSHNVDPSLALDIWSYMCLFAELYTGIPLFRGSANATAIRSMVNYLGPLPESWKGQFTGGGSSEDAWYNQQRMPNPGSEDLRERLERLRPDVSSNELDLVLGILRWGLAYRPEERPTALEILQHSSFKSLMQNYGIKF
ncbi:unnamed protein product [Clonostachys chloroleuca]|uniref:Protein kinase domain-containing protein n=1 Tax=Clonostachys chloroleuca TaxID=1926264 RepID=A0AA35ME96_9HYPO|nr:unnamed protein product [Clonostachys chloroleuca]